MRNGPSLHQPAPRLVCNGCRFLQVSMKMRGTRGSEDFWDCGHDSQKTEQGYARNIGSGSGQTSTPDWCPFLNKGGTL